MEIAERLKAHIAIMAPHQKTREAGALLIGSLAEIERLRAAVAVLRLDAERHRHARLCAVQFGETWTIWPNRPHRSEHGGCSYDAAIDAAMAGQALQTLADEAQADGEYGAP